MDERLTIGKKVQKYTLDGVQRRHRRTLLNIDVDCRDERAASLLRRVSCTEPREPMIIHDQNIL